MFLLVFEEERSTTVSMTGGSVNFNPVTNQLKLSHNEEYMFLKNRSSPLSPLRELSTLVHFHTVTNQLKWSHNEEYLFLKKRCSPLSPWQELRYTFSPSLISWNEVKTEICLKKQLTALCPLQRGGSSRDFCLKKHLTMSCPLHRAGNSWDFCLKKLLTGSLSSVKRRPWLRFLSKKASNRFFDLCTEEAEVEIFT